MLMLLHIGLRPFQALVWDSQSDPGGELGFLCRPRKWTWEDQIGFIFPVIPGLSSIECRPNQYNCFLPCNLQV